jgi:hypothetical protein
MNRRLEPVCILCRGSGWLCDEHPMLPWDHDDCDGVGIVCECNAHAVLPHADVFVEFDRHDGVTG